MSGDRIQQYGAGSIGKAEHTGSGDIVAGGKNVRAAESTAPALDDLLREIQKLRPHLDEHDRAEVDASVEEISANPSEERFRKLLRQIAGIATLIGETGAPVILAVRALLGTS
ncbi:hypothetical protein [Streptomyces sp. S.PB5]|uniref:hypothetical protein n=1 Tax=Streptomyces sp. S.PB5 TaxID=3020844 RepID=UPI0025AF7EE8|nr:hypothetical protein [Streptomyces sp. S.PB5]MDN3028111.1 hypothetical protein [Streptomyces sp. S.PB5]